jgi:CubicO group peptidase (beta-lactamase class C family)
MAARFSTRRILLFTLLAAAIVFALTFDSCLMGRYFVYNFSDINDHEKFDNRPLQKAATPFRFKRGKNHDLSIRTGRGMQTLSQINNDNDSRAFLVIRNDSILYEGYFKGYADTNAVPSFSMAKSFTSALIGCAIADGLIGSVDDKVTKYLYMKDPSWSQVSLRHLLDMTSGMDFDEGYYSPFTEAASFYYGRNLRDQVMNLKTKRPPGQQWEYVSGSTQLLGQILEKALKGETITAYLQRKIWTPLGMEFDAGWSIDDAKTGMEKTFCCINARARDYAKFGRLYLNRGNWEGKQLIPEPWVTESTKPGTAPGCDPQYHFQWWLRTNGAFTARGHLGQYIYVQPAKKLIIVRLGASRGELDDWLGFFDILSKYY